MQRPAGQRLGSGARAGRAPAHPPACLSACLPVCAARGRSLPVNVRRQPAGPCAGHPRYAAPQAGPWGCCRGSPPLRLPARVLSGVLPPTHPPTYADSITSAPDNIGSLYKSVRLQGGAHPAAWHRAAGCGAQPEGQAGQAGRAACVPAGRRRCLTAPAAARLSPHTRSLLITHTTPTCVQQVYEYLEIEGRVKLLNDRFSVMQELLDILRVHAQVGVPPPVCVEGVQGWRRGQAWQALQDTPVDACTPAATRGDRHGVPGSAAAATRARHRMLPPPPPPTCPPTWPPTWPSLKQSYYSKLESAVIWLVGVCAVVAVGQVSCGRAPGACRHPPCAPALPPPPWVGEPLPPPGCPHTPLPPAPCPRCAPQLIALSFWKPAWRD